MVTFYEKIVRLARRVRDDRAVRPIVREVCIALRALRPFVPPSLSNHLIYHGTFKTRVHGGQAFLIHSTGSLVENRLFWRGWMGHEPESVRPWAGISKISRVAFDIGANTGLYSLIASACNSKIQVHAFEPVPRIAEMLKRNVNLNPSFRIQVHQAAVGATSGESRLFDPGGEVCYSASLNATFFPKWQCSYPVRVLSIDDFMKATSLKALDLVKVDVESLEESVLEGMTQTIQIHRPALFLELIPKSGDSLIRKLQSMCHTGYRFFHLAESRVIESKCVSRPTASKNVVLCPEERVPPGFLNK